ncbi:MAG: hypothetical protein CMM60_08140 [Rhodospirillaceae bacterium]|nr:hypothetical protein [Rhodospirillaceae bacterium]
MSSNRKEGGALDFQLFDDAAGKGRFLGRRGAAAFGQIVAPWYNGEQKGDTSRATVKPCRAGNG